MLTTSKTDATTYKLENRLILVVLSYNLNLNSSFLEEYENYIIIRPDQILSDQLHLTICNKKKTSDDSLVTFFNVW